MKLIKMLFVDKSGDLRVLYVPNKISVHEYETVITLKSSSKSRLRDLHIKFFFPPNDVHQEILELNSNFDVRVLDSNDNKVLGLSLSVVPPKKKENITIRASIKIKPISFANDWGNAIITRGHNVRNKGRLQPYWREEINRIVDELGLASISDPKELAIKVVSYIRRNIRYFKAPYRLGGMFALKHGKGSCDEIADLTVAILKACGLEVRSVVGYYFYEGLHEWVEIKTSKGWIPIDPTMGIIGGLGGRWLKIFVEPKPSVKLYSVEGKGKGTININLSIDKHTILRRTINLPR